MARRSSQKKGPSNSTIIPSSTRPPASSLRASLNFKAPSHDHLSNIISLAHPITVAPDANKLNPMYINCDDAFMSVDRPAVPQPRALPNNWVCIQHQPCWVARRSGTHATAAEMPKVMSRRRLDDFHHRRSNHTVLVAIGGGCVTWATHLLAFWPYFRLLGRNLAVETSVRRNIALRFYTSHYFRRKVRLAGRLPSVVTTT